MITVKRRIAKNGNTVWRVNAHGAYRWFDDKAAAFWYAVGAWSSSALDREFRAEW
jgi:hypothetical protein